MPGNVLVVPNEPTREPTTAAPSPGRAGASREATRPRLSRRSFLASLTSLPLFLATACSGLPSPIAFPTATPTGPRSLRLAFPGGTSTDYTTVLVKDVAQHFPPEANLQLEPVYVDVGTNPADLTTIATRYAQALSSLPAKDTPDLILCAPYLVSSLDKGNVVQDLRDTLKSDSWFKSADFYGNALVTGLLRGKQLAVPLDLSIEGIFYNQQRFAEASVAPPQPGWSWDQFLAAAQTLTTNRSEDSTGRWGCQIIPFFPGFDTIGWQRGAKVVGDDAASLDLTEPGTAEGMQFLADLILGQKVSPPLSQDIVADPMRSSQAINSAIAAVGAGQVAMIAYATTPYTFWWRPLNMGDVALAEMPVASRKATRASVSVMFALPTTPPDQKHSLDGLRYLLEASSESVFLPARRTTADLRKLQPFLTEEEAAAVRSTLDGVRFLPPFFTEDGLFQILSKEYVVPILAGQKTAAQAGRDVQPLVREALATL